MSNHLKLAMIDLDSLPPPQGLVRRRIAHKLDLNRETVARYLRQAPGDPNQPLHPQGRTFATQHKTSHCTPRLKRPGHGAQSRCPAAGLNARWQQSIRRISPVTANRGETSFSLSVIRV